LIAPKSKSNGKIVDIACNLAVSIFNDGFSSILEISAELDNWFKLL